VYSIDCYAPHPLTAGTAAGSDQNAVVDYSGRSVGRQITRVAAASNTVYVSHGLNNVLFVL